MSKEREDENEPRDEDETADSAAVSESKLADQAMAANADDGAERSESSESRSDDDLPAAAVMGTRGFGIDRYIQAGFAVLALFLFWVLQQSIVSVWNFFTEPNVTIATAVAAFGAIGGAFALYRHERFGQLAREIAIELSKVTWPSREETQISTVVVIVTSVVAALYLGVFDFLWSAVTDLLYSA